MAYTGNTLSLIANSIEGSFNIFCYQTTDPVSGVLATDYFVDGVDRGMHVGDFVFAVVGGIPFTLYVSAEDGFACTVTSAAVAIDFSHLPTTNPGAGSGLAWNNAGFLCIA